MVGGDGYGGIGLCYRYEDVVVGSIVDGREKENDAPRFVSDTGKGAMCIDRYVVPVGLTKCECLGSWW